MTQFLYIVFAISAFIIAAIIVLFVLNKYLKKLAIKTKTTIDDEIIRVMKKPLFFIFVLLGLLYSLTAISLPYFDFVIKLVYGALLVISTIMVVRILSVLINAGLNKLKFPKEKISILMNFLKVLFYVIGTLTILTSLGLTDVFSLALSLGLIGFGLTFSLQYPLSCVIGWLFITGKNLFNVGDRISIVGGITTEGDVTEIGYIFTRLREVVEGTYTGRLITIPNSTFMSGSVSMRNIALSPPCIRDEIAFTIAYESDLSYVKKIMIEVAEDTLKKGSDVKLLEKPEVFFEPAEGGWVAARLRYLVDFKSKIKSELTEKILEPFNKEPDKVKISINEHKAEKQYLEELEPLSF